MKIEGDTLVCKSYKHHYADEISGRKCCTVRQVPENEWNESILAFTFPIAMHYEHHKRIRIVCVEEPEQQFERAITHVEILGGVLYHTLLLICWRHEEEEQ